MVSQTNSSFITYFMASSLFFLASTDIFSQSQDEQSKDKSAKTIATSQASPSYGCLPYYQSAVEKESFFSRFGKPSPLKKMKYLLFSILPQIDKKHRDKGEKVWEELNTLGVTINADQRAEISSLFKLANDFKIFCADPSKLWTFPQLIKHLPQLQSLIDKSIKTRENYLLLKLQEHHQKNHQLQAKFKNYLEELLKGKQASPFLSESELKKIKQFEEDQKNISEDLKRLKEFYLKLPGDYFKKNYPRWEKLFSIKELTFTQIASSLINVKNYTRDLVATHDQVLSSPQLKDLSAPELDLLSLAQIEKMANIPWDKQQDSRADFEISFNDYLKKIRSELVGLDFSLLKKEIDILQRPLGKVVWYPSSKRTDKKMEAHYFNPRTGKIHSQVAPAATGYYGLAYNPLSGKVQAYYSNHAKGPLYGRFNKENNMVEWGTGHPDQSYVFVPWKRAPLTKKKKSLFGVYVPPFFREELQDIQDHLKQKNTLFEYINNLSQYRNKSSLWNKHIQNLDQILAANENISHALDELVKNQELHFWREAAEDEECLPQTTTVNRDELAIVDHISKMEKAVCPICFDPLDKDQSILLECGHITCQSCFDGYVDNHIQSNEKSITCPTHKCPAVLDPEDVCHKLGKSQIKHKWQVGLYRDALNKKGAVQVCKRPDCPGIKTKSIALSSQKCHYCSACLECGANHSQTLACNKVDRLKKEEEALRGLKELFDADKFRLCPKCKTGTERIDGCNHITCTCKHHWHWYEGVLDKSRYVNDRDYTWANKGKKYKVDGEDQIFKLDSMDSDDIFH